MDKLIKDLRDLQKITPNYKFGQKKPNESRFGIVYEREF